MIKPALAWLLAGLLAIAAPAAAADAPAQLARCQATVASASTRYLGGVRQAVTSCLKLISKSVVAGGATTSAAAASAADACVKSFGKLKNSAKPKAQLADQLDAALGKACDPAVNPGLLFAAADTVTVGATTLSAANLGMFCRNAGGNGTIASFADWKSCLRTLTDCQAHQSILLQWPRAVEYLQAVEAAIASLPPTPATADAVAVVTTFATALAQPECGVPSGLLVTGQQGRLSLKDEDSIWRAGVPFEYADNGDGTISDRVTGLVWEKLDRAGGVHDVGVTGSWSAALAKVAQLNQSAFAGHTDWRVPNRRELLSLVDYGPIGLSVQPAFNSACASGCASTVCSCTAASAYWSSSAYVPDATRKWIVSFGGGSTSTDAKQSAHGLRAVRGGQTQTGVTP